tara:strand:+ start:3121 stop:4287 length:1167 start_codon:yes stop_codon:yes gene_type:complete
MAPTKTFFDIVNELSMKSDKKLPNLKTPVKGKKGTSKFMRMKVHNAPYTSDYKKAMNASVDSADKKPEKYMKPDGKMGIRMVKTDKEIIKKESSFGDNSFAARLIKIRNHPKVKAARKAHAAGTWDGNVDKEGEAVVHINGKPHTVTNKYSQKKQSNPDKFKPFKKKTNEAKTFNYFDSKDAAHAHAKKHGGKVFVNTGKGATKVKGKPVNTHVVIKKEATHDTDSFIGYSHAKRAGMKVKKHSSGVTGDNVTISHPDSKKLQKYVDNHLGGGKVKEEVDVDEALNLAQRMKRSRLMKRMKSRIKIGKQRAMRKMANKKTLEKRSMRQARNAIAKKLTRGIPKKELTFARKKEIEKRLEKPALQQRIKRLAKRMFKDVRKKEVERKKG